MWYPKEVAEKVLFFKVVLESLVERKSWGDIAVDDIKVLDGLSMVDCKGKAFSFHSFNACIQRLICNFTTQFSLTLDFIRISV